MYQNVEDTNIFPKFFFLGEGKGSKNIYADRHCQIGYESVTYVQILTMLALETWA